MGWKTIKGYSYYYETHRVGGRHETVYRGGGEVGQLRAELDRHERLRRGHEANLWRAERERRDADERAEAELFARVEAVARAALTAAGYHLHKREWRRRRMAKARSTELAVATEPPAPGRRVRTPESAPAPPKTGERKPLTHKEVIAFTERAQDGDKAALAEVKAWLDHEGRYAVDLLGSPQRRAEDALIEKWARGPVSVAAATKKFDGLHAALAGKNPSPLERLLVSRVVFCWFALNHAEWLALQDGGQSFRTAEYMQNKLDRAHRRFLSACRTLATVRKLAMPGVPLVAIQQNLMAAVAAAADDRPRPVEADR